MLGIRLGIVIGLGLRIVLGLGLRIVWGIELGAVGFRVRGCVRECWVYG